MSRKSDKNEEFRSDFSPPLSEGAETVIDEEKRKRVKEEQKALRDKELFEATKKRNADEEAHFEAERQANKKKLPPA